MSQLSTKAKDIIKEFVMTAKPMVKLLRDNSEDVTLNMAKMQKRLGWMIRKNAFYLADINAKYINLE